MADNKLKQYFEDTKKSVGELTDLVTNGLQKSIDNLSKSMSGTNINTGISQSQVKSVDDLATKLLKIKEIQESLNVTYTRATSLYNNMAVGEQKLATEVAKTTKAQNSLADAIDKKAQKEAQAAAKAEQNAAKTSAAYQQELRKLEELGAQYRENYLTLGKNAQATRDSLAAYNNSASGLRQMNTAMGSAKSQAGNLAYQTNSLTMILSELPNAGISARIFIMSLSNNILPLMQQFKALSMEVDQFGNTLGKIGALKAFAKSLLGINAIAMIAVSLFVAYSDSIMKWVKNIWEGTDALNNMTKAQNAFNEAQHDPKGAFQKKSEELNMLGSVLRVAKKAMDDFTGATAKSSGATTSSITNAELLNKAWQDITRSGTAFKKVMGEKISNKESAFLDTLPDITSLEGKKKAINEMQNLFNKYQDVIKNSAAASDASKKIATQQTEIQNEISKAYADALRASFPEESENGTVIMARKWITEGNKAYLKLNEIRKKVFTGKLDPSEEMSFLKGLDNRTMNYVQYLDKTNALKKKYSDLQEQQDRITFEKVFDIETQNNKKKARAHVRTQQEMYEKEKFYSEERVKLQERNMDLEEQINKETSEGTINTYSQRLRAAAEYYQNEKRIQQINKEESLFNTDQEYAQKLVKLSNYLKGSTNSKDKATKKELDEAKKNYTKEMANAGQNYELRKQAENNYFDAVSKIIKIKTSENKDIIGKEMQSIFGVGNVDLLTRPLINASELVKKGWKDAGDGIATVYSSSFMSKEGDKDVQIHVTPILKNGKLLSPKELSDYVENNLYGATNILEKDSEKNGGLGIVLKVGTNEAIKDADNWDNELHKYQEKYYITTKNGNDNITTAQKSFNQVFTTMNKNRIIENKEANDKEVQENLKINKDYSRQLLSIINDRISDLKKLRTEQNKIEDFSDELSNLEYKLDKIRKRSQEGIFDDFFKGTAIDEVHKYEDAIDEINLSLENSKKSVSRAETAYNDAKNTYVSYSETIEKKKKDGIAITEEEREGQIKAYDEMSKAGKLWADAVAEDNKNQQEGAEKSKAALDELQYAYAKMALKTFGSSAISVVDAYYNHLFKQIEKEKELNSEKEKTALSELEDRYNAGATAADGELLTKEKYEKEKARIEAYYEALNDNLDEQKEQKEKEQFELEKAAAIASAIMSTAQGIASVLPHPGLWAMIPWISAIGAMQIATITAQMLMYKDGTDYHPKDSMAIVNDGQHKEVVQRPNENPILIQGKNVPIWLPQGSKVFKSEQDYVNKVGFDNVDINAIENKELMKTVSIMNVVNSSNNDYLLKDLIKEQRINNKILREKNLNISTSIMDKARRDKYYKRGGYCG